jgi:phospho-N-acetylmuramoyl-pentapeptide-transferase
MLSFLGQLLEPVFGPFRLLSSHLFLIVAGTAAGFIITVFFLPRFFAVLPGDRGREFAHESGAARGKPTGAGVVFVSIFALVSVLMVPWNATIFWILILAMVAMLSGYLDDRSIVAWGEYLKGLIDFVVAVGASILLFRESHQFWIPFASADFAVSAYVFIPISTIVIWISINSTNCTDGVDGLSSMLVLIALVGIGFFLYFAVGHVEIADYLLLPHYADAAEWAIMVFTAVGCVAGYLWHNAYPSRVLMGDAGSRALGFIIGVAVIASGNPLMLLATSSVVLVNGGTGLVKVAVMRFFRLPLLKSIRFPLHDHFRKLNNWSNTQVLVRFSLLQMLITIVLLGIFIKIR